MKETVLSWQKIPLLLVIDIFEAPQLCLPVGKIEEHSAVKKSPLKVYPLFYLNCCLSYYIALTSSDDHLKGSACMS